MNIKNLKNLLKDTDQRLWKQWRQAKRLNAHQYADKLLTKIVIIGEVLESIKTNSDQIDI